MDLILMRLVSRADPAIGKYARHEITCIEMVARIIECIEIRVKLVFDTMEMTVTKTLVFDTARRISEN